MATRRYQSPQSLIDSATSWGDDLERVIRRRMQQLGIRPDMIGLQGYIGVPEGRAFVRFPDTQIAGNLNAAVREGWKPGIAIDHGVLDIDHPRMLGVPAWRDRTSHLRDRADAVIAHEYIEALLSPPADMRGPERVQWLHEQSLRIAPETKLPITERARDILRQFRDAEGVAP